MANCKFCGKPVRCATVHHAACWEKAAQDIASIFCDKYCHWPFVCKNEEELAEEHCSDCALVALLNLGL